MVVEVVVVRKYYNHCLLSIAGPFFHWWYGFLEKIPGVVLGQATSKLNKSQQNLVNFIVKLAVNQLVMTPQLQLAIKLLQMCKMELVDMIQQEMTEIPMLEEVRTISTGTASDSAPKQAVVEEEDENFED